MEPDQLTKEEIALNKVSAKSVAIAYFVTLVVFVAIDFVWLSVMAARLYQPVLGDMLAADYRIAPAVAFYFLYGAGLTLLAVVPGLEHGSALRAALRGAVLGLTAYATYDLTNQATLRDWPLSVTLADIPWGTFVTAIGASAGYLVASRVG